MAIPSGGFFKDDWTEDDEFGDYSYLTYMARYVPTGAPSQVFQNMAATKSGDFKQAVDEHVKTLGINGDDPLAGYEEEPGLGGEEEEAGWGGDDWGLYEDLFYFVTEEGAALRDSFDDMEDGDMEQGLRDVEGIVSSTIPIYKEALDITEPPPGLLAVPGPVPKDSGFWENFLGSFYPKSVYALGPPPPPITGGLGADIVTTQAQKTAAQGPQFPTEPPPGLLDVLGPVPEDPGFWERVGDVGSNLWNFLTKGQEAAIPGQQEFAGGYRDIGSGIVEGVGGFVKGWLESEGERTLTELELAGLPVREAQAVPVDPSIQRDLFTFLNNAWPDIDQVRRLLDPQEMGGATYTVDDLKTWFESPEREGIGDKEDEKFQREFESQFMTSEEAFEAAERRAEEAVLPTEKPSYADQFTRIFNNIPGSQRSEAQRGKTGMFNDAEMLFYLSEDWGDRDWLTGDELTNPTETLSEQDRKGEELIFANWVQNTYLQNPRQTRFGEEFYGNVRDLRDNMFKIKDLTMEELYDTLTSDWEMAPQTVLGDAPFPPPEGQYQQTPAQAKKTVMDRFVFMAPESSDRLARLVGMYNIHPGADHWLKSKMMNFYSGMMNNWLASGRDSYDFIKTFVKDKPAMPSGDELPPISTASSPVDYDEEYDDAEPWNIGEDLSPGGSIPPLLGTGAQFDMDAYIKSLKNTFGGAATTPVHTPKGYEPIPPGMVRMGTGEIITLDELRRRIKPPKKDAEKWTMEFEDILSGLK